MRRMFGLGLMLLMFLTVWSAPSIALADPSPFCNGEAAPTLDQAFAGLATLLADRAGTPKECSHTEQASGDLQQATSGGLFYLRKSTNTPTFTDGADHWALRGTQSLHWTTSEADPPSSAEVSTVPSTISQPAPTPVAVVAASAALPIGIPINFPGTAIAVIVVVVGLVLCIAVALMLQQQRRRAQSGISKGTQLVAARATGAAGGLSIGTAPYMPAVPVSELQSAITDIGTNRVTEQADAVLRADPEAMIWQGSPSAAAILMPGIIKWAAVLVVAVSIRSWVASSIAGSGSTPSSNELSTIVQWLIVGVAVLGMARSVLVSWVRIFTTKYRATRQRLEITSGVFGQTTVTYELFELRNAVIERPFVYRLLGVGNLLITHRTRGAVRLHAIANPDGVRDILRSSGQIEAARFEKAQWR
jgi:PH (Pleckstrin Homology) domain-containing protein